jgi:hypothetical protein
VLTRVDFSRFKYYEPYESSAYGSTYAPASMLQEAAR